ncbi:hypothetical protein LTR48_004251 [Friedmanniomyces endolithicus]|uniref:Uncharacterized protein n=1 Tax=Rachicladosporium monterosium TaxID=1507873 RepID=A0ABR0L5W1_9PEZI|nr:hypothetical protein LTR29_004219 [Friedmanniomyces endolithicus]KAK1092487.1 hypothetical protein LTR48_004251 [Friedmanniomyces endolithicus]KAK1810269.1 hypothetical protein LTR12_015376 [Friedmanniomyces endolithicus]KAK5143961.1 hypothetical protein LTR32_004017 [Rachicladosporium monterosium]
MDGTKHGANGKPVPHHAPIDLGATSPWALPPMYHEESALRYTQSLPNERAINTLDLLQAEPRTVPLSEKPSSCWRKDVASQQPQTRRRVGRHSPPVISPLTNDGRDDSDDEIEVDTERDEVYLINTNQSSYSRTLGSEDYPATLPHQAVLALQHMLRAKKLFEQQHQSSAGLTHSGTRGGPNDNTNRLWHNDLLLRKAMRYIKRRLRVGDILTIERLDTPAINLGITCAHPLCPAPGHKIPLGAYYIALGAPGMPVNAEHYCVFCLEDLWNGKGMVAPLPEAPVLERVSSFDRHMDGLALGLDGAMDDESAGLESRNTSEIEASTPRLQPSWSGMEEVSTPATRYGSTALSSPASSTHDGAGTVLLPTSPMEGGAHPRVRRSDDLPQFDGVSDTIPPLGHVKLAKKRGVTKSSAVASSNYPPDARKVPAVSRELRDLSNGFGEAFLNGQAQTLKQRRVSVGSVARRSARQPVVTQRGQSLAAMLSRKKGGDGADSRQPNAAEGMAAAGMLDGGISPTKSQAHATIMSADTVGDKAMKAGRRLDAMYRQREQVLASLGPGESGVVRPPGSRKRDGGPRVGKDAFGVPHTEAFAEHVKYYSYPAASAGQAVDAPRLRGSSLAWPMPRALSSVLERGPIRSVAKDGVVKATTATMSKRAQLPPINVDVGRLFASRNTMPESAWPYGLGNAQLDGTNDARDEDCVGEGADRAGAPSCEDDSAPAVPKDSSPRQTFNPASLLASRHAPTIKEWQKLAPESPVDEYPRPETPGLPHSPSSTTSSGRWKEAPMRSQLLATYIRAGESLDEKERAAVELWRMASKEQLGRERHLVRAEEWRERCRRSKDCEDGDDEERRVVGRSEVVGGDFDTADRGGNREIVDDEVLTAMTNARLGKRRDSGNDVAEQATRDESTDDEEGLEAMCGLKMKACRAKDLSTVLGELRRLGEAEA